jgi:hypothetical protein
VRLSDPGEISAQFRQPRRGSEERKKIIDSNRNAVANGERLQRDKLADNVESGSDLSSHLMIRTTTSPSDLLDLLSRYEVTLWRQARQIVFKLQRLDRRKPWEKSCSVTGCSHL